MRVRIVLWSVVFALSMPVVVQAADPAPGSTLQFTLPTTTPRFAWDVPDLSNDAVAVEGDVDETELRRTLRVLEIRRTMLTAHQVMAWTSAFTLIAVDVIGLVNRIALQTGSIPRRNMEPQLAVHRILVGTALTSYMGAGILAWTMPSPSGRREHKGTSQWNDSRDKHIILSIIHNIAMGVVTVTGILQANVVSPKHWEPLIFTHTSAGFVAAGFVMAAAVVIGRM